MECEGTEQKFARINVQQMSNEELKEGAQVLAREEDARRRKRYRETGMLMSPARTYSNRTNDELRTEIRRMQHELLDREVGRYRGLLPADMDAYQNDNAPRQGCTLVVHLEEGRWSIDAYAPGYAPVGPVGLLSNYASRPHGSIGIAIQAIIDHGFDWRHALPEMKKAENAYAESSASIVTR